MYVDLFPFSSNVYLSMSDACSLDPENSISKIKTLAKYYISKTEIRPKREEFLLSRKEFDGCTARVSDRVTWTDRNFKIRNVSPWQPSNLDEKSSCQSFLFLLAVMFNPS